MIYKLFSLVKNVATLLEQSVYLKVLFSSKKIYTHPRAQSPRGGLMVSALDSRASGPPSSPGREHCAVLLGKTLYPSSPRSKNECQQI